MVRKPLAVCIMLILALTVWGCSQKKTTYSGFLKDYSGLQKGPEGGPDLVYKKPGVDFSKYKKVMVEPVVFYLKKDAEAKGIQPKVMAELEDAFEKEIVKELNGAYPMVDKPGPDVLRIRIAITDVEPSNPALGTVGAVMPAGMAINLISNVTTGSSVNVGSASMEAEFLDSETGEVVGKVVDHIEGSTYDTATLKGKWGHTKKAFQQWAKMLRNWLDSVHGKKGS